MPAKNSFEEINDRIIKQLEEGVVPWRAPWLGYGDFGPRSHATGELYSFMNQMILGRAGEYLTFAGALAEGGHIKKGARAKSIFFWTKFTPKEEKTERDKELEEEGFIQLNRGKSKPFLKKFNVFHIDDTDGIEPKTTIEKELRSNEGVDADERAEEIWRKYCERENLKYEVDTIKGKAYYTPSQDKICVPSRKQFKSQSEYYSVLFHELVHSTGHKTRLNRDISEYHKKKEFRAQEELIAEIGASALCSFVGVTTEEQFQNNVAYIDGWKSFLKDEKGAFVYAACRAQKAVDLILGRTAEKKAETTEL